MESSSKRNILYALGAGAAIIGAAIIYSMMKSGGGDYDDDASPPEVELNDMEFQLIQKQLKDPKRDGTGALDEKYFIQLL